MAIVSRLQLNHPALGTAGGAGLHASIEALYTKIGDNMSDRYFAITDFDNAETADLLHNFNTDIENLQYDLYYLTGGVWERITEDSTPSRSDFTIAEKAGAEKTTLLITNVSGGADLELAVVVTNSVLELREGDVKDVDITTVAPEDGQALVYDATAKKFKPGASGDSSLKLQAIAANVASVKAGYMGLNDGRIIGSPTDLSFNLKSAVNTAGVTAPGASTTYYLYVDLLALAAATTVAATGMEYFAVTSGTSGPLIVLATKPRDADPSRYVALAVLKTDGSSDYTAFSDLPKRVADLDDSTKKDPSIVNYVRSSMVERNISGWNLYADAAAALPVDGTGGSANLVLTRNTTTPLRGLADLKLAKDAANRQGQGLSYDFTIDRADQNKTNQIAFDFNYSGAYAAGDLICYIYDVTNAALIATAVPAIAAGKYRVQTTFVASSSLNYRLIFHVATTNAAAWDIFLDDLYVGPTMAALGAPMTEWASFTPTGTFIANTTYSGLWRRRGSDLEMQVRAEFTGAPTTTTFLLNVPFGLSIDTTKIISSNALQQLGFGVVRDGGIATYPLRAFYQSATTIRVQSMDDPGGAGQLVMSGDVTQATPIVFGSNDSIHMEVRIPIAEWAGASVYLNQAVPEYAYNTSVSDADDTSAFAYGPVGNALVGDLTAARKKRVRFLTPIQPTDKLEVQIDMNGNGCWEAAKSGGQQTGGGAYAPFDIANSVGFGGIQRVTANTTDVDVLFARYRVSTLGWSGLSGARWRVVKIPGQVQSATVLGDIGTVVQTNLSATGINVALVSGGYTDVAGLSLAIPSAGTWLVSLSAYINSGAAGGAGGDYRVTFRDGSNNLLMQREIYESMAANQRMNFAITLPIVATGPMTIKTSMFLEGGSNHNTTWGSNGGGQTYFNAVKIALG